MGNNNDYGVYLDGSSPVQWVKTVTPLFLSSADQAQTYNEMDAISVATYLTSTSENTFKVGRPGDRQP